MVILDQLIILHLMEALQLVEELTGMYSIETRQTWFIVIIMYVMEAGGQ